MRNKLPTALLAAAGFGCSGRGPAVEIPEAGAEAPAEEPDAVAEVAASDVAGTEPPFRELQGCALGDFVDERAPESPRTIRFTHGLGQLAERCMRVAVGQTVSFVGDLSNHPLQAPVEEPDNPIARHENGKVTFLAPGVFGFICGSHPAMRGAIWADRP
jgi:hypothetical protein